MRFAALPIIVLGLLLQCFCSASPVSDSPCSVTQWSTVVNKGRCEAKAHPDPDYIELDGYYDARSDKCVSVREFVVKAKCASPSVSLGTRH